MTRTERFLAMKYHPMFSKLVKRLSKQEFQLCLDFLKETETLNNDQFTIKVNRWYVGDANKPKHHVDMWALVAQSM
jgi:hypothetical protein